MTVIFSIGVESLLVVLILSVLSRSSGSVASSYLALLVATMFLPPEFLIGLLKLDGCK